MTAKEILAKIKAVFDGPMPPPPAAPPASTGIMYTLQDGTQISIIQAGDDPAIGDMVTANGSPVAAGTYTLQDGSTITTDAMGMITATTPVAAPAASAAPPPPAQAPPAAPVTHAQMEAMAAKFAVGTADERLTNLEVMAKAMMQCLFGYEIAKVSQAEAVEAYQNSIAMQLSASYQKATEQEEKIKKQDEVIKGLFELAETLVNLPTEDAKTLTGNKKERFERVGKREAALESIAAGITAMKNTKRY